MNLYLMRHGESEPQSAVIDDFNRQLTVAGKEKILKSLPGMKKLIGQIDYMMTSNYVRAIQTSHLVGGFFKCMGFIENTELLAAQNCEDRINKLLNKIIGKEHVLLVGHIPHLEDLTHYYVGEKNLGEPVSLKPGSVAKIYIKGFPGPGEGMLRWVMTSEELAASGR